MSLEHAPQREHGALAISRSASPALEPLLSVAQVSEITGRSISTLEKDRLYGNGPPYVKMGRLTRYRPADVRAWLAERVRRSTSDSATATREGA
jgi:predicted DNA-binding transcriptional regulator AlpA